MNNWDRDVPYYSDVLNFSGLPINVVSAVSSEPIPHRASINERAIDRLLSPATVIQLSRKPHRDRLLTTHKRHSLVAEFCLLCTLKEIIARISFRRSKT